MWTIGPILILMLFIFRLVMPYKIPEKFKGLTLKSLENEFKKIHLIFLVIFFILLISTTFISIFAFEQINNNQNIDNSTVFNIRVDFDFWIIISIILGISVSILLLNLFLKIKLKENSVKFWIYYNLKYKFNALLILNILTGILLTTGILMTYLGNNSYVKISDKNIRIKSLFSLNEKVFNYSDVKNIVFNEYTTAPNGDKIYKPHYKVIFTDNYEWSSISDMREPKNDDNQIFEYISKKTNLAITSKESGN
jgi:hypothetical protein